MTEATGLRRERVEALSARRELLHVMRVAMVVTTGVWLYLASAAAGDGRTSRQRNMLPFQKLVADVASDDQRVFRELQEGLIEAEAARAGSSTWPTPHALADEGIPPFAIDPTQRIRYDWQLIQAGTIVNYVGIPKSGDAPAWLLFVQEPEAGVPPDQTFEDEEHHRLGGAMLHVSTWMHADGRDVPKRAVRLPQAEGWTQLFAVGSSASAPASAAAPTLAR